MYILKIIGVVFCLVILSFGAALGDSWHIESVDTAGDVGYDTSIALDSSDYPHISYFDNTNRDLKYAYSTGSAWSIISVDTTGDVGYFTSIALDSSNYPHISYYDISNGDLKYAYWTGSAWSITSVDTAGDVGWFTSIALDSSDNPYISYCDYDNGALKCAHWNGSAWSITSIDATGDMRYCSSIALDSSDNPHISYYDEGNGDLKYARYGPNIAISLLSFTATAQENSVTLNWQVETTPPMAGGEQIAGFNLYRREINNDIAAEVGNLGCRWMKVNSSLITGQNPYSYTDCACPAQGGEYKLEAVLTDQSTETLGTTSCAPTRPAFAITKVYPNPASDVLNIALTVPQAGEIVLELYDLTGRLVTSAAFTADSAGETSAKLDVSGLASGLYTLRAVQDGAEVTARAVVAR
jgi:hypothetical protein